MPDQSESGEAPSQSDEAGQAPAQNAQEGNSPKPKARRVKKGRSSQLPRTEAELNRPEPQGLWMLGVISVATIVMWGAARAGCNDHPPRETRRPRAVGVAELTADPKNAAIEAMQRWATRNYSGAEEIATQAALAEISAEAAECRQRGPVCEEEAKALKGKVLTTAELLTAGHDSAWVRVTTHGAGSGPWMVQVVREAGRWKIAKRELGRNHVVPAKAGAAGAASE